MTSGIPERLIGPAVDTLPLQVAILDDSGTILYTNRAWREFGERNDIDGASDTIGVDYLAVTESAATDTAQTAATGLRKILAGERERFELEYPCHSPDERRWFLMRAVPFDHDGVRYVTVAHADVTDRNEYRQELERSNERLERFAHALSHDLQEPLRMVTQYLQLLERRYAGDLDEEATTFVDFAVDGAERMSSMIDGLLAYARVERSGDPLEPIDLEAVLADVLADLSLRIEETDATVDVASLPRVEGDPNQLRRVFQNLLSNAIEYSGDAPPRIHVDADRDSDDWIVTVRDEGIGVPPDDRDRVFEVFERLHGNGESEGSGIGLAICRRIVERHGGEIWVESELGQWAAFRFTLPAADT